MVDIARGERWWEHNSLLRAALRLRAPLPRRPAAGGSAPLREITPAAMCPKLQYLSLLGNAGRRRGLHACGNELVGATKEEAERYRLYRAIVVQRGAFTAQSTCYEPPLCVVHRIPTLRFLDAMPVTEPERRRAVERGGVGRG
eukprot:gene4092-34963_t